MISRVSNHYQIYDVISNFSQNSSSEIELTDLEENQLSLIRRYFAEHLDEINSASSYSILMCRSNSITTTACDSMLHLLTMQSHATKNSVHLLSVFLETILTHPYAWDLLSAAIGTYYFGINSSSTPSELMLTKFKAIINHPLFNPNEILSPDPRHRVITYPPTTQVYAKTIFEQLYCACNVAQNTTTLPFIIELLKHKHLDLDATLYQAKRLRDNWSTVTAEPCRFLDRSHLTEPRLLNRLVVGWLNGTRAESAKEAPKLVAKRSWLDSKVIDVIHDAIRERNKIREVKSLVHDHTSLFAYLPRDATEIIFAQAFPGHFEMPKRQL